MRLLVARCEVRYTGRLTAVLPEAMRLILNQLPVVQFLDSYRVELIERGRSGARRLLVRSGLQATDLDANPVW
jgi:hypothetical protein